MFSDIMSGLMGASNFESGFIGGQDQGQDRQLRMQQMMMQNQQYNTASQMNALKLQNEQQNMGFQQDRAQYARQLGTDPDTMNLPPDQIMDRQMHQALAKGDVLGASEFATNATNYRQAQARQDQEKVTALTGKIKQQQDLATLMGGPLAVAADQGEETFNKTKADLMQQGVPIPNNLVWDADLARRLRVSGMTAQQSAQDTLAQARIDQQKAREADLDRARKARLATQEATLQLRKDTATAKAKAGGAQKAISKNDLDQAAPYLADTELSPTSPDFAKAQEDLVSVKRMIQKANPNIPEAQAFMQAKEKLKSQFVPQVIPGYINDTKKMTYVMRGATPKDPIPFTGDTSTLIPGRYYNTGSHGVTQFTGTGWKPVSDQ